MQLSAANKPTKSTASGHSWATFAATWSSVPPEPRQEDDDLGGVSSFSTLVALFVGAGLGALVISAVVVWSLFGKRKRVVNADPRSATAADSAAAGGRAAFGTGAHLRASSPAADTAPEPADGRRQRGRQKLPCDEERRDTTLSAGTTLATDSTVSKLNKSRRLPARKVKAGPELAPAGRGKGRRASPARRAARLLQRKAIVSYLQRQVGAAASSAPTTATATTATTGASLLKPKAHIPHAAPPPQQHSGNRTHDREQDNSTPSGEGSHVSQDDRSSSERSHRSQNTNHLSTPRTTVSKMGGQGSKSLSSFRDHYQRSKAKKKVPIVSTRTAKSDSHNLTGKHVK